MKSIRVHLDDETSFQIDDVWAWDVKDGCLLVELEAKPGELEFPTYVFSAFTGWWMEPIDND